MTNEQLQNDELTVDQWLAIRKEEGARINPETAEVMWTYALTFDPYHVYPDLPEELQQVGREYFARTPDSDIWVWFGDLPRDVSQRLREKHFRKLCFPAGLPEFV